VVIPLMGSNRASVVAVSALRSEFYSTANCAYLKSYVSDILLSKNFSLLRFNDTGSFKTLTRGLVL